MSVAAEPEDGLRSAKEKPGQAGASPGTVKTNLNDSGAGADAGRRAAAGALVGIATGGFFVALLAHVHVRAGWSVGAYEPPAALLGALGAWWFGARRGTRDGWFAVAAALAAMLLGDFFWALAHTPHAAWWQVPVRVLRELGWRGGHEAPPLWSVWPKLLRYGFGLYVGWYVGSATAAGTTPRERKE